MSNNDRITLGQVLTDTVTDFEVPTICPGCGSLIDLVNVQRDNRVKPPVPSKATEIASEPDLEDEDDEDYGKSTFRVRVLYACSACIEFDPERVTPTHEDAWSFSRDLTCVRMERDALYARVQELEASLGH